MDTSSILIVDDDRTIADAVAERLTADGHTTQIAGDGLRALDMVAQRSPDLVVLDIGLPGLDGIEVCRRLRSTTNCAVVMLTARDDETDMLVGLGVGADDYVVKPFSPRELSARVNAVLRRTRATSPDEPPCEHLRAGHFVIDVMRRKVNTADTNIHLTVTEFDLLVDLARAAGAVRTREQLMASVWGYRDAGVARTVDSHIRTLRKKLDPDLIRTVHGVGYAIEVTR